MLPLAAFYRDRARYDGLNAWCTECKNREARARREAARPEPPPPPGFRRCPCPAHDGERVLPLAAFHVNRAHGGRASWCRKCTLAARREARARAATASFWPSPAGWTAAEAASARANAVSSALYRCPRRGCPVVSRELRVMVGHVRGHETQDAAPDPRAVTRRDYAWHGDPALADPGPGPVPAVLSMRDVCARAGLSSPSLLTGWAKAGLLPPAPGARQHAGYGPEILDRVAEIQRLKADGLTLAQIRARLDQREDHYR